MKPTRARQLAEECRMAAGTLFAIALVSAITAACIFYSLGPGLGLLACISVASVCALGFLHELAEARRHERIARQSLPTHYENHGHE